MDDRQQQIRAGAGLEESRLNTDFINFVQKWGGPFLFLCAALMGAWAGWNWWQKQKGERLDAAYAQYEAQVSGANPSPEALKAVADEFEGVGAVSLLARLDAADVYVASLRSGIKPGVTLNPDGTLPNPEDALSEEDRTRLVSQATDLYRRVLESAQGAKGRGLLAVRAAYGLAAVAESTGDIDGARGHYQRLVEIAEANDFDDHATIARARLEGLDALSTPVAMLSQSELPVRPAPPPPPAPVLPDLPAGDQPAGPTFDLPALPANPLNPEGGAPTPPPATEPAGEPPAAEPSTPPATEPVTPPAGEPTPPAPGV